VVIVTDCLGKHELTFAGEGNYFRNHLGKKLVRKILGGTGIMSSAIYRVDRQSQVGELEER
jgi:hypothetical protein